MKRMLQRSPNQICCKFSVLCTVTSNRMRLPFVFAFSLAERKKNHWKCNNKNGLTRAIESVEFDGSKKGLFRHSNSNRRFRIMNIVHVCIVLCVPTEFPNFTLNWLYAFTNAVRCWACACLCTYALYIMHIRSIPSPSRFINLIPFRFHFVCVCAKFILPRWKFYVKFETDSIHRSTNP